MMQYLADGAETLLSASVAGKPLSIPLLLTIPSSKTPQQKSCFVLLDITVTCITHLCNLPTGLLLQRQTRALNESS